MEYKIEIADQQEQHLRKIIRKLSGNTFRASRDNNVEIRKELQEWMSILILGQQMDFLAHPKDYFQAINKSYKKRATRAGETYTISVSETLEREWEKTLDRKGIGIEGFAAVDFAQDILYRMLMKETDILEEKEFSDFSEDILKAVEKQMLEFPVNLEKARKWFCFRYEKGEENQFCDDIKNAEEIIELRNLYDELRENITESDMLAHHVRMLQNGIQHEYESSADLNRRLKNKLKEL